MSSPALRVQIATYNFGAASGLKTSKDLASWLQPTLSSKVEAGPADIIAVGFQEVLPLHYGLLGWSKYALDAQDQAIAQCIGAAQEGKGRRSGRMSEATGYTLVSKSIHGGMALLVYTRDETVTARVNDVRVGEVGTGIVFMANKGAVGVRMTLSAAKEKGEDDADADEVYTFVCAHLAAHEHKTVRRNQDWQSIVQRLIFSPSRKSSDFSPSKKRSSSANAQIWDTSYLFVFGDLNYRISKTTPKQIKPTLIVHKIHNDLKALIPQDQLRQELKAGRTLHTLLEGKITFKPTYKYIVGEANEYKAKKRTPSWTDRVLYASWAEGRDEKRATSPEVVAYRAIQEITLSDHKPVTAVIDIPRVSSRIERPLRLATKPPFAVDSLRSPKALIGGFLNRLVGSVWCFIVLLGAGSTKRGIPVLVLLILATLYMQKR